MWGLIRDRLIPLVDILGSAVSHEGKDAEADLPLALRTPRSPLRTSRADQVTHRTLNSIVKEQPARTRRGRQLGLLGQPWHGSVRMST